MRFGAYILVSMLFLGLIVGDAAAYLNVYNSSPVNGGQRISIPVFWSGSSPAPTSSSWSIKKAGGSIVDQGTGSFGDGYRILYTVPGNYTGNLTLKVTVSWADNSRSPVVRVLTIKVLSDKVKISFTQRDYDVESGGTANFTASASTSASGASISSYSWTASHGSFNQTTGSSVTWTAPTTNVRFTAQITVEATDSSGNSETKTASVLVYGAGENTPEDPPSEDPPTEDPPDNVSTLDFTIAITADKMTVSPGETVNLTADVTLYSSESIASYQWSATSGTLTSPNGSETAWRAPNSVGEAEITVTAVDNNSQTKTANLSITIVKPGSTTPTTPTTTTPTTPTSGGENSDTNIVASPPKPTVLKYVSGNNQSGYIEQALTEPFVVKVLDQYDKPMIGVEVIFTITEGDGSLTHESVNTDVDGLASNLLTLGIEPGINKVKAEIEGIVEIVVFDATAMLPPPVATTLSVVSGENQSGYIESALPEPFVVEVLDQYADPMKDIAITFTVTAGDGSLSHENVNTDKDGMAQSTLTFGAAPITNTVAVNAEGITEAITFEANATILGFDLMLQQGFNFIHVPLNIRMVNGAAATVLSVRDLYNVLGGEDTVNFLIMHDPQIRKWIPFFIPYDIAPHDDILLTEDMGIMGHLKTEVNIRLSGLPLGQGGRSTILLNPGVNFVGLPLQDTRIIRVSDLLNVNSPENSIIAIVVVNNGKFMIVGRAGDPGDIEIGGGQSFIIIASQEAIIEMHGQSWQ